MTLSCHGLCKSDRVKQSVDNLDNYRLFAEDKLKLFISRESDQCGPYSER